MQSKKARHSAPERSSMESNMKMVGNGRRSGFDVENTEFREKEVVVATTTRGIGPTKFDKFNLRGVRDASIKRDKSNAHLTGSATRMMCQAG